MSFYLPSDPGYVSAKRLKQGSSRLDTIYDSFVATFDDRFGFPPLAISVDTLEHGTRPRLGLVLERSSQCLSFNVSPDPFANYDAQKQRQVAQLFVDTIPDVDMWRLFGMSGRTPRIYSWRDDIFVIFTDFERTAKWEVSDLVPRPELDQWVASLGLREQFWCAERFAGPPIVFVHTDDQAAALRNSRAPDSWADSYFALASQYDEFGYLTRDDVTIVVDSKQNFDANYASKWYHYFR